MRSIAGAILIAVAAGMWIHTEYSSNNAAGLINLAITIAVAVLGVGVIIADFKMQSPHD